MRAITNRLRLCPSAQGMVHVQSTIAGTRREPTHGIERPRPADEIWQRVRSMVIGPHRGNASVGDPPAAYPFEFAAPIGSRAYPSLRCLSDR